MIVTKRDGSTEAFDTAKIDRLNAWAVDGLKVDNDKLKKQIKIGLYDGMPTSEILEAQELAAAGLISANEPAFTFVAARYRLADTIKQVTGTSKYPKLISTLGKLVASGRVSDKTLTSHFSEKDIEAFDAAIKPERDLQFDHMGLKTVVDRYLLRDTKGSLIELPQHFFMRVAMGLSLVESEENRREFVLKQYEIYSCFDFMSSTPTLFNSMTKHSQLASCYLNTTADSISVEDEEIASGEISRYASIFGTIEESARLSKFAGGIGTDWNRVRPAGSHILSTNGKSSGITPYLKIQNDTAVAVNQGGKRKGSMAPYLQPWHPDFPDFCELKKEFGDDHLRAHDLFPAAWIPDVFMDRVWRATYEGEQGLMWSFVNPSIYPELNEMHGPAFTERYEQIEAIGGFTSQMPILKIWRHIITNLFETGHPWITFKDECNRRNPQGHVGIIRSSNLCTEITENTSDEETAVCNLGSINMAAHIGVDLIGNAYVKRDKLRETVRQAVRCLDNVIDINFYPSERARRSNMRHRPIGLGQMGETEAKLMFGVPFDCEESVRLSSEFQELISFYAIEMSADLAREKGSYSTFEGSKWSHGLLPVFTARGADPFAMSVLGCEEWEALAEYVKGGMRNSNVMAIAPTATISNIVFASVSIEPVFEVERVEKNMSGTFTSIDPCTKVGRNDLLTGHTAFEIDQMWVVRCGAARQVWIDQSQSLNLFAKAGVSGKTLASWYLEGWKAGLKTTYYLRGQSNEAPSAKKEAPTKPAMGLPAAAEGLDDVVMGTGFCGVETPGCESCQ